MICNRPNWWIKNIINN